MVLQRLVIVHVTYARIYTGHVLINLATAMDPMSKVELLTNHPEGRNGDEEPSEVDLPSDRVPGSASDGTPELGFEMTMRRGRVSGK